MPIASLLSIALVMSPSQAAAPQPTTPDGCVTQARTYARNAQQALARTITAADVRRIEADKQALARACAAQFAIERVNENDLPALITLYGEAGQRDLASAAITRALASRTMASPVRAQVLEQAIVSTLLEPKSEERNTRLESWSDALDRLPGDLLAQQMAAHSRLNGYYRGDDIDAGIIKHSTWIIDRARTFTPAQRAQFGSIVVSAHINMAEAWAGQGDIDKARALLQSAREHWSDIRNAPEMLNPVVARYALVGTIGAPIGAPRWLNAAPGTTLPMTGAVTLLEFTAHWCGPCKESYPGIKRLLAKYGPQGFRAVFATELYGYFGTERGLSADEEFDRDRDYFAKEGLAVPIAVENARRPSVRNADGTYTHFENPNDKAYEVGGIPQIHIIDRHGRIRLIMVGYDDANEPALARLIEKLLKER